MGLLLAEQTSEQVLWQGKTEGFTNGACLFDGEASSSRDKKKLKMSRNGANLQTEVKINISHVSVWSEIIE